MSVALGGWLLIVVLLLCFLPSRFIGCLFSPASSLSFTLSLFTHTGWLLLFAVDCWFFPMAVTAASSLSRALLVSVQWKLEKNSLTSPPTGLFWNYNSPHHWWVDSVGWCCINVGVGVALAMQVACCHLFLSFYHFPVLMLFLLVFFLHQADCYILHWSQCRWLQQQQLQQQQQQSQQQRLSCQ